MRHMVGKLYYILVIGIIMNMMGACSWFADQEEIRFSALRNFEQGNLALKDMDYHTAIINYRKAVELDERTPEFHYNLGLAYHFIEKYDEALKSYKDAAEIKPEMAESYYNSALIYYKLYNIEKAHQYYNKYQELMVNQKQDMMQNEAGKNNNVPIKFGSKEKSAIAAKLANDKKK